MKNYSIELLRFIAVVLIVFTHTRNNYAEESIAHIFLVEVPRHGTVVLSIISGFLYWKVSRKSENLLRKKTKSLLIPYLIANISVLALVLILNKFGINFLNRLSYDSTLITNGIFSLNDAPINPPTYFIRDLFVVFLMIETINKKDFRLLIIIILIAVFGELMLRYDILIMFSAGALFAKYKEKINKRVVVLLLLLLSIILVLFFSDYSKYAISMLLFVVLVDMPIKFFYVGGYTYMLHLYHSPIMVVAAPIINKFTHTQSVYVFFQILFALAFAETLYLFTRKFNRLKILTGGR